MLIPFAAVAGLAANQLGSPLRQLRSWRPRSRTARWELEGAKRNDHERQLAFGRLSALARGKAPDPLVTSLETPLGRRLRTGWAVSA